MTDSSRVRYRVYVGTYTDGESEGIYVHTMDASGRLEPTGMVTRAENPTFLDIHPNGRFLYSVNEIDGFEGATAGSVTGYSIDPKTGGLTEINRRSTGGPGPCHLSIDSGGRWVMAANYVGGSICVLPIADDGSLGNASDFVQHEGSSVDPERQTGPHAHSITPDRADRYTYAADLGLDRMMVYRLDTDTGKLAPNDPPWTAVQAGAGPRHFAFHPDNRHAYVINEMDSTVTVFAFDEASGRLSEIQNVSTLPREFEGESWCADVHPSPSGRFLYGSNRGHDSIAVFEVDLSSGRLTAVDHVSTRGQTPRNFAIDPTGTFLLAANQDTDTVVTFRLDERSGVPVPTGDIARIPAPVCVKLIPFASG